MNDRWIVLGGHFSANAIDYIPSKPLKIIEIILRDSRVGRVNSIDKMWDTNREKKTGPVQSTCLSIWHLTLWINARLLQLFWPEYGMNLVYDCSRTRSAVLSARVTPYFKHIQIKSPIQAAEIKPKTMLAVVISIANIPVNYGRLDSRSVMPGWVKSGANNVLVLMTIS